MRAVGAARRQTLWLFGVLAVFYGAWAWLWFDHAFAFALLEQIWGVSPVVPEGLPRGASPLPFFDLEGVISWSECARKGVDVFAVNPCDPAPYHRVANYSPLIVDLPLQWIGVRHSIWAGLVLVTAFLIMLPFLLQPKTPLETAVIALAVLSHATFYAVERANIDLFVFLMVGAAVLVSQRTLRGRLWFYGAALAGALIKYYPLVLLGIAVRERLRIFLAISYAAVAVMAVFVWRYWQELHHVSVNLPFFHVFSDMFGAVTIPITLVSALAWPSWTGTLMLAALVIAMLIGAVRLSGRLATIQADWNDQRSMLLLSGAAIMVGCFLLQTNNSYRAVFLLMVIPGLMRLWRLANDRIYLWAVAAALICMWCDMLRILLPPEAYWGQFALFLGREILWWFEAAVLTGVILGFVRQAAAVKEAVRAPLARFW